MVSYRPGSDPAGSSSLRWMLLMLGMTAILVAAVAWGTLR